MSKCYVLLLFLSITFCNTNTIFSQTKNSHYFLQQPVAEFGFGNYYTGSKDFLELSYGIGDFKHKNLTVPFNSLSLSEIKLGRRFTKPAAGYKIIHFTDNYLFSSYVDDYQSNNATDILKTSFDVWRFGLGYRKGYGYNFSNILILPYHTMGFVWNRSQFIHPFDKIKVFDGKNFESEIEIVKLYDREIKFGTNNIGGLQVRLSSLITVAASYETAVIFPYHKFWKQFGSFFIETFAQTGIDFLTEGVLVENIPKLVPIIYFILKNGLSYYMYTLKQEEMNWPFETVSPLTLESLKFSIKIGL